MESVQKCSCQTKSEIHAATAGSEGRPGGGTYPWLRSVAAQLYEFVHRSALLTPFNIRPFRDYAGNLGMNPPEGCEIPTMYADVSGLFDSRIFSLTAIAIASN